jgi:hypothetical protein
MKWKNQIGTLIAAAVLVGNAYASTNIPETTAGDLTIHLGANPGADDVYSVLHTTLGSFVDTYTFSVSNTASATAAYGTLALPNLYGITATSFNLYRSGGTLVSAGTITTSSLSTSAGLISTTGLTNGSYYYQFSGSVIGDKGGAYQFSQITEPVPEPSTYALTVIGLCAVGYAVVRQRRKFVPQTGLAPAA